MDRPRALATAVVAADAGFRAPAAPVVPGPRPPTSLAAPQVRAFFLLAIEREPEPHFQEAPGATAAEAGTSPASRSAVHGHWVEAALDPPVRTRAAPGGLREVLVGRGPVGDLLGQEFLDEYAEADGLLALQAAVDRERTATDAARWDAARKTAIEAAQRALEDAFYAAAFPHRLVVTAFERRAAGRLADDLRALRAPRARFVDAADGGTAP